VRASGRRVVDSIRYTYLLLDSHVSDDLEERMAKPLTIVGTVEACKADESALKIPAGRCLLFNPVCRDRKITICITSLPCIAC
jgi:hypothetical protein